MKQINQSCGNTAFGFGTRCECEYVQFEIIECTADADVVSRRVASDQSRADQTREQAGGCVGSSASTQKAKAANYPLRSERRVLERRGLRRAAPFAFIISRSAGRVH